MKDRFMDGYAQGIQDAANISMAMPLTGAWSEITERVSETTVQAMAWRASMAILKRLPAEEKTGIGRVDGENSEFLSVDAWHVAQTGTTKHGRESIEQMKDRFAGDLLKVLSQYPEIFVYGREHEWGVGCGDKLRKKLAELAKNDAEKIAAMNVVGVRYD